MNYKNIVPYILVVFVAIGFVKACEFVIRKPEPISREVDPRILQLDSQINVLNGLMMAEAFRRDSVDKNVSLRLDSIRLDHLKSKHEKKKLKNTPDSALAAYNDSLLRANGLK